MKKIILFLFFTSLLYSQEQKKTLTLLFNSNDFLVTLDAEILLNTFFLDETISIETITISGFCDDVGTDENNKILSNKRANAVAEYLQDNYNLEVDELFAKGEIALNSSEKNIEFSRKNNRKVVLEISYLKAEIEPQLGIKKEYVGYKTFQDKLKVGDKIILENILFKGSSTYFVDDEKAAKELSKIVTYLNENPKTSIEIQGHVCCISKLFKDARDIESGKNNLSFTRAKKIFDFLISKGITTSRMTYAGYGRQFPLPNTIEELNKRVEIVIVDL
ncbi:OmpA family protein [Flavobacterium sp.]|uniref:OmpA family protein n=1 Tax=Flavobacterium sp. TaxID=239 RepID=UPI003752F013